MSKKRRKQIFPTTTSRPSVKRVDSLWEHISNIKGGYGDIVGIVPKDGLDLVSEFVKALKAIGDVRGRPCVAYNANVVRQGLENSSVDSTDDLPFAEMVASVPLNERNVDVLLSTWGGSAHQISRFVNCLRSRFDAVDFIIPSYCMSAGTLFALSGDNIHMTPRACLGPIDPQVPCTGGRYVPAQALLLLINQLQVQGDEAMKKGLAVPWTLVRIIDTLDKKELADAISATRYSTMMATQFLVNYKFKNWSTRATSGLPVDQQYRETRANEIAAALANHDLWKSHGHAISRETLWQEVQLKIEHPSDDFESLIIKTWALLNWIFDKTPVVKLIVSSNYRYVRTATAA